LKIIIYFRYHVRYNIIESCQEINNAKTPYASKDSTDVQNIENSDALEVSEEEKEDEGLKRTH